MVDASPQAHVDLWRCLTVAAPPSLCRDYQHMPSSSNLALNEVAGATVGADGSHDGDAGDEEEMDEALRQALGKLVRSKGFMWLAFTDKAAMYWSHAGEGCDPRSERSRFEHSAGVPTGTARMFGPGSCSDRGLPQ